MALYVPPFKINDPLNNIQRDWALAQNKKAQENSALLRATAYRDVLKHPEWAQARGQTLTRVVFPIVMIGVLSGGAGALASLSGSYTISYLTAGVVALVLAIFWCYCYSPAKEICPGYSQV